MESSFTVFINYAFNKIIRRFINSCYVLNNLMITACLEFNPFIAFAVLSFYITSDGPSEVLGKHCHNFRLMAGFADLSWFSCCSASFLGRHRVHVYMCFYLNVFCINFIFFIFTVHWITKMWEFGAHLSNRYENSKWRVCYW